MKRRNQGHGHKERGIALITVLLALLLLTAIALGAMYMTNMETGINANFRTQQVAYFAARAGLEETRVRMMKADPNSLYALISPGAPWDTGMVRGPLTFVPTGANGAILYVLNEGNQPGSVQPWNIANAYVDDELCHDGYTLPGLQAQNSIDYSVRCTTVPVGNAWYRTAVSTAPWNGTAAALTWKWARVALKLNGSQQNYPVDGTKPLTSSVCFNAANEVVLAPPKVAQCQEVPDPTVLSTNPVFLVTVLAVTPSGARRMVQAELGLQPTQPFQFGMFATGLGCGALTMGGGGTTDAYNSALGGYGVGLPDGSTNVSVTGGDVGANGNVTLGGGTTTVGGSVGTNMNAGLGACNTGFGMTTNGGAGMLGNPAAVPCSDPGAPPNCIQAIPSAIVVSPPSPPAPPPPTTNKVYNQNASWTPGTFGNVSVTGGSIITIAPGTYNFNSLTLAGNSTIVVSPPGAVVFNFAGQNLGVNAKVLDLTGGTISNPGGVPKDFQILYAGTNKMAVSGGAATFMQVDAPNAAVDLSGSGDFYGAILGKTVTDTGGAKFHYDLNSSISSTSNAYFTLLAFRESFY